MNELLEFSLDTENPQKNYNLGVWYENQNHTGPAHTYYLRAAERAEDKVLAYKSLLRSAICCRKQNSRDFTEKSLLKSAISYLPERPEAYYFLATLHEKKQEWEDCYMYACLGLSCYNQDIEEIGLPEYPGKYGLIFQRAISSWWWGKGKESRELLHTLVDEYWDELDEPHKQAVEKNLIELGENIKINSHCYKSEQIIMDENVWEHNELIADNSQKIFFDYPEDFDWADLSEEDIVTIQREIVHENVYRFWNDVKENDIVLDIGSSVGAYTISIIDQKPKKVYCVEPSKKLLKTLIKNCSEKLFNLPNTSITYINHAIVQNNTHVNVFGEDKSYVPITFKELIKKYSIDYVNYMKIDCEGGEYDIFNDDSIEFIMENVEFISMEIHLKGDGFREKFKNFRDNYLSKFNEYKVISCTRQNIKWEETIDITDMIFEDKFIDEYDCEFMVYINNKKKN